MKNVLHLPISITFISLFLTCAGMHHPHDLPQHHAYPVYGQPHHHPLPPHPLFQPPHPFIQPQFGPFYALPQPPHPLEEVRRAGLQYQAEQYAEQMHQQPPHQQGIPLQQAGRHVIHRIIRNIQPVKRPEPNPELEELAILLHNAQNPDEPYTRPTTPESQRSKTHYDPHTKHGQERYRLRPQAPTPDIQENRHPHAYKEAIKNVPSNRRSSPHNDQQYATVTKGELSEFLTEFKGLRKDLQERLYEHGERLREHVLSTYNVGEEISHVRDTIDGVGSESNKHSASALKAMVVQAKNSNLHAQNSNTTAQRLAVLAMASSTTKRIVHDQATSPFKPRSALPSSGSDSSPEQQQTPKYQIPHITEKRLFAPALQQTTSTESLAFSDSDSPIIQQAQRIHAPTPVRQSTPTRTSLHTQKSSDTSNSSSSMTSPRMARATTSTVDLSRLHQLLGKK